MISFAYLAILAFLLYNLHDNTLYSWALAAMIAGMAMNILWKNLRFSRVKNESTPQDSQR